jgi:predicted PhzF superfamily epimerase YddE/YHI9
MRPFRQVDVFSSEALLGNPVAVVHDADGLTLEQMQRFAAWTNLSETTFLLTPTDPGADYRLRIFTPGGELPFAGHPTLGSAHAWLEAGGEPAGPPHEVLGLRAGPPSGRGTRPPPARRHEIVQECGAGLVRVRRGDRLAFEAPRLVRSGPVSADDLAHLVRVLRLGEGEVLDAAWVDNGPGWVALLLKDAATVLDCRPELAAFGGFEVGVVGAHAAGESDADVEVRAFVPSLGVGEDPVTGSLNAGLGQWLAGSRLPSSYVASQGTVLGRRGRVHVSRDGDAVWVGGDTRTVLVGDAHF